MNTDPLDRSAEFAFSIGPIYADGEKIAGGIFCHIEYDGIGQLKAVIEIDGEKSVDMLINPNVGQGINLLAAAEAVKDVLQGYHGSAINALMTETKRLIAFVHDAANPDDDGPGGSDSDDDDDPFSPEPPFGRAGVPYDKLSPELQKLYRMARANGIVLQTMKVEDIVHVNPHIHVTPIPEVEN